MPDGGVKGDSSDDETQLSERLAVAGFEVPVGVSTSLIT